MELYLEVVVLRVLLVQLEHREVVELLEQVELMEHSSVLLVHRLLLVQVEVVEQVV